MRQLKISPTITNRESKALDRYLHEIAQIDLLTAEEEVMLTQKIREGDKDALDRLVKANLRFVVSVAKQYHNEGMELLDLINEGNLGLITAAERFDETRGFKFISFAVWWIRQRILASIPEQSRVVRLPLNQVSASKKIYKMLSRMEQEFQREPTIEELAKGLDMTFEKVAETLRSSSRQVSMDAPFTIGEENTLLDIIEGDDPSPDSMLMNGGFSQDTERLLSMLRDKREREVIEYFFGIGREALALEEIGERLNLTRERIRQIKEKALKRLRKAPESTLLKVLYLAS